MKTSKDISKRLEASAINNKAMQLEPSLDRRSNKPSKWSKSFKSSEGSELETLSNIFGFNITEHLKKLFKSTTSGDGDEKSKILTLHSSSLVAFVCFLNITDTPITINGIEYNEVMFEVKNDVIDASLGKPSNVDVLLMGEHRTKLLFLESKFTEYLSGGRAYLSENRYKPFYDILLKDNSFPFYASKLKVIHKDGKETQEYCLNTGSKTCGYLGGIKQAFSHLLGIATGPVSIQATGNEIYTQALLDEAYEIRFGSIIFNCDAQKFDQYNSLYKSIFKKEAEIKRAIQEVLNHHHINHSTIINKMVIEPELLSYQKVFNGYKLPDAVRQFYSFVNDSTLIF